MSTNKELDTMLGTKENRLKFTCKREELLEAFDKVSHAVMKKAPVPILGGVLLTVNGEQMSLTGFDLDFGVCTSILAWDTTGGKIVVPAKRISDLLDSMTQEELMVEEEADHLVIIKCGASTFQLVGMPAEDFPVLPALEQVQQFSLPAKLMAEMIQQTAFVVRDAKSHTETGVMFDVSQEELALVACDGRRLAVRKEDFHCGLETQFMVPAGSLWKIKQLLAKADGDVVLSFDGQQFKNARILAGNMAIVFQLAERRSIDYKRFIPSQTKERITLSGKELLGVIKQCDMLKGKAKQLFPVQFRFQAKQADIFCESPEGSIKDSLPCGYMGGDLTATFDTSQLLSILKELGKNDVCMVVESKYYFAYISSSGSEKRWFILAQLNQTR